MNGNITIPMETLTTLVYGDLQRDTLMPQVLQELKLLNNKSPDIHVHLENIGNANIVTNINNHNNQIIYELVSLKSAADELQYDIERENLCGKEYQKIQKDINRIENLIDKHNEIAEKMDLIAKTEKKSILNRILKTVKTLETASKLLDPVANSFKAVTKFIDKLDMYLLEDSKK